MLTKEEKYERHKLAVRRWQQKNRDKVREIHKKWVKNNKEKYSQLQKDWVKSNPEKVKEKKKRYNEKHKEKNKQYLKKWKEKNIDKWRDKNRRYRRKYPLKHNAHNLAHKHISIKDKCCEICGEKNNIHRHHPNYVKPLEVKFLCQKCHNSFHIKNKLQRRT